MARVKEPRPVRKEDTRTLKELRESRQKLRIQVEEKLLESLLDYDQFGGSDLYFELRTGGPQHWMPPSVPSDRRHGAQWPVWRWDQELDRLRNTSRILAVQNAYAKGLLKNNSNYVIGKGFAYKAQPVKDLPDEAQPEYAERLAKSAQRVIDRFLRRTKWNGLVDPRRKVTGPIGTREKEIFRRVQRDGEALVRFFFLEPEGDKKANVDVRFMEPEQLRNPGKGPDGEVGTQQNGWTYGIRHQMQPAEDTEAPEWYHFVFQDQSTADPNKPKESPTGEFVPAEEIVHFKNPDEDFAVKRGLPQFAWDTAEAFIRASKLQRFMSQTSTVRAATAEIWKHSVGTQAQISQLAQGIPSRTERDPITQGPEILQRLFPGMVRRVPAGQEPVQIPENNAVSQQLEAAQGDLRQGSAGFCAPEFLTGDASNANYASTKEAGAPYVNEAEGGQEFFKQGFLACVWKAVAWAIECGELPEDVYDLVDIQVEAPQVIHTDGVQRAQEDQILTTIGAKSPQTCAMERGLDPEVEMQRTEEYHERMGQPGQPLGMPDENGDLPPDNPPMPSLESLLESGFTGTITDRRGRKVKYVSGKRVKGSEKPAAKPKGEGGKSAGTFPALKAKATDLVSGAKAMAAKLGGKVFAKLPKAVQKTLAVTHHYGSMVYHALEAPIHAGKALAVQVAKERGLPAEHVERVGRIIGIADGLGNWVHYGPLGHHVGHVLELGSWGSFGLAKAAMITPWAALAYIGYSATRCPACVYQAAKKALTGQLKAVHESLESVEPNADTAGLVFELLSKYSDRQEMAEALVMAGLDLTGDLAKAVKAADKVLRSTKDDFGDAGPEALNGKAAA